MRKKRILIFVAGCFVLILAAAAVFLCLNPQYPFIAGEFIGVRCKKTEFTAVLPEGLYKKSIGELADDDRVRFDQSLMLVNTDHMLGDNFVPEIGSYGDSGVQMNVCMMQSYAALSSAVNEKTGERLLVSSDYRTYEQQVEEYDKDPTVATKPGASEHQTGLALDVYVPYFASYGFIKNEAGRFVDSECWKYGFIIRYPVYGEKETGIVFEPWHIRYVGEPHAGIIYNNHLTLEGYIDLLEDGTWYSSDGYMISRQTPSDSTLVLPADFREAVISPDNTGGYIITLVI